MSPSKKTPAAPEESKPAEIAHQVVIIEATGRVRRHGFTIFKPQLGEKVLVQGEDFEEIVEFSPAIDEAEWYWKDGRFEMSRKLKRGESPDWTR